MSWLDDRIPLSKTIRVHMTEYYVAKNLNGWYYFGSLALLVLIIQIISGIWLTMYYTPTAEDAFASVEFIMRDVNYGWLFRYMHSTGASFFFIIIYLHMTRALIYGSYKSPRELIWLLGMMLFVLLMAEAFFGYLLPWGQMSFWGAQVITSLLGAIPWIGDELLIWIRGDYTVSGVTLHRYFALHVIAVPLLLVGMIFLHIVALHSVGSNNPDGIDINKKIDGIPFHPYYTVKDSVGVIVFLIIFSVVLFFMPTMGGYFLEPENATPANPLVTPDHIIPAWYLTPFYSILRAIPDKLLGVIAMGASIALLFVLPWLDRSGIRSMRYRSWPSRINLGIFMISFIGLGLLGIQDVTPIRQVLAQLFTLGYFVFFIGLIFTRCFDRNCQVPERLP